MNYYTIINAIVTGICFGFGLIFLFIGLRRRESKRLNLLFAIFALAYAATLFNGIRFHNATSVDTYLAIIRGDAVFVITAFIALIWYIAEYTNVKPRPFLWLLTAAFAAVGVAQIFRANLTYDEILGLAAVMMPWGEEVAYLEATDSAWSVLFLMAELATLGYMVFACLRQYLLGRRRDALVLSIGVSWFVASILAEILGQVGVLPPLFYGEFGFLGFAIALSLQMANNVIRTEEELAAYRLNLEEAVSQRTIALEEAQQELLLQAQRAAADEERSRLARDLHDAVTQTIYSAALIAEVLPQVWERNPEEALRNLAKLRQLVRGALAEMRALLFELRPAALETADLETLVRQLADALTGRTRVPVNITVEGQPDPPPDVKIAYYRITQEAFNNIAKHAATEQVNLTLVQSRDRIRLEISDDGRGFDPATVAPETMGLSIMEERATGIGARLTIHSATRQGTSIALVWTTPQEDSE